MVGVWKEGAKKGKLIHGLDWSAFTLNWEQLAAQGLRLIDVQSYIKDGSRKWAGLFRPGTGGHALYVLEWPAFTKKWDELSKTGLRLVGIHTYKEGGKDGGRVHGCLGVMGMLYGQAAVISSKRTLTNLGRKACA